MKNKPMKSKHKVAIVTLGLLTSSSYTLAATYDSLNGQENNFDRLEQIAPSNNGLNSPSILPQLQQAQNNEKKAEYLEVLNLIKKNDLKGAKQKIAALLKQYPNVPEYYNLQALLESSQKNSKAAQENYEKALKLDDKNVLAYLGLAKLALDNKDLENAKKHASKAVAINDKAINAYLILADIALNQKNNSEVEKILMTAFEKVNGNISAEIEILKNLGKFYALQKQLDKLLAVSQEFVTRHPNDPQALSTLAEAQLINGKKELAAKTLQQIIDQDKQDIGHRLLLAQIYAQDTTREKETLKLIDDAIAIDKTKPQAIAFKTAYLAKLKRYPEAMENADLAEKQFPKTAFGKLLKADVYLAQKLNDKALDAFKQAYKLQVNEKVMFTIADLLIAESKLPEAIKFLDGEAKKDKTGAAHFKLGTLYQEQKDYPKAETHYLAVLKLQPENALALNNIAWLYSLQNNPKALEFAKKAYEKAPESSAIIDTYGYILVKQGQAKEGLPLLEKAVKLTPNENGIRFHLAEAYVATGDKKQALNILESLAKTEQKFAEQEAAITLLNQLKSE